MRTLFRIGSWGIGIVGAAIAGCVEQPPPPPLERKKPGLPPSPDDLYDIPKGDLPRVYRNLLNGLAGRAEPGGKEDRFPIEISNSDLRNKWDGDFIPAHAQNGTPHQLREDTYLKGMYAIGRFYDEVTDGRVDGKIDLSRIRKPVIPVETYESAMSWVPRERVRHQILRSGALLEFRNQVTSEMIGCGSSTVLHVTVDPETGGDIAYLVTNKHVIAAAREIPIGIDLEKQICILTHQPVIVAGTVQSREGEYAQFTIDTIMAEWEDLDLALFKVRTDRPIFRAARIRANVPTDHYIGHSVLIRGFAFCQPWIFEARVNSVESPADGLSLGNVIFFSGVVNAGQSGGHAIDPYTGEIVALIRGKRVGEGVEGVGFGIPADKVYEMASPLIEEDIQREEWKNLFKDPIGEYVPASDENNLLQESTE